MLLDLSKIKAIMFDMDGTLVDSMSYLADLAATKMEQTYGMSFAESREQYLLTSGLPFFMQLEKIFPGNAHNEAVAKSFEDQKWQDYFEHQFYPEVETALSDLRAKGLKIGVSSNNGQEIIEEFISRKTSFKFDLVCGFKPDFEKGPAHFQKMLDLFKLSKDQLLFVGDSLHDAKKGLEFGLPFVGRSGTFSEADFTTLGVSSVKDLGLLCR